MYLCIPRKPILVELFQTGLEFLNCVRFGFAEMSFHSAMQEGVLSACIATSKTVYTKTEVDKERVNPFEVHHHMIAED